MKFILTRDQQETLLQWASEHAAAEAADDVEPSGYVLQISVSVLEVSAEAIYGSSRLDLGVVELVIE
jgi:hypothetical protein